MQEPANSISSLIIQKRRQLAAKHRTTNHARRISVLQAQENKRAIEKALRVIRLHSRVSKLFLLIYFYPSNVINANKCNLKTLNLGARLLFVGLRV